MFKKKIKEEVQSPSIGSNLIDSFAPFSLNGLTTMIETGDYLQSLLLIMDYPSNVDNAWLSKIANIDGTTFTYHVYPADNMKLKKMLDNSITELETRLNTQMLPPMEHKKIEKQLEDAYAMIERIVNQNENLYYMIAIIQVYARSKELLEARIRQTETLLASMGMRGRIASHLQEQAWISSMPLGQLANEISPIGSRNMMMDVIAASFPFIFSGINDGDGVLIGKDMSGGIALIDIWKREQDRGNGNMVVLGRSGTGKSTLLKKILLSEYARGAQVIILDPEREYQDLALNLNANWINCGLGSQTKINPLQIRTIPRDDDEEDTSEYMDSTYAQHISTLRTFFQLYLKEVSSFEQNVLEETIEELYAKFGITAYTDTRFFKPEQYPIMSDLMNLIEEKLSNAALNDEDRRIYHQLKVRLRPAAKGADQSLWNGHTTVTAEHDLVVLDIFNLLESSDNIKKAQFFNILSYIWHEISKDREKKKILVVDECHLLVDPSTPASAAFLRNTVKRIRKYMGLTIVSTQNMIDLLDPSVRKYGMALLQNSCYHMIFGMKSDELQELVSIMNLSEKEEVILNEGKRGECLATIGMKRIHLKVDVSDFELKMFGKKGGK